MAYYATTTYDLPTIKMQLLAKIRESRGNWLAIIDSAFDHGGKALSWFSEVLPVYHEGRLSALREVSPILVGLSVNDEQALERECRRLLHHCKGRPMLGFIQSEKRLPAIRQGWQSVLEVETSDSQLFLLRFADTRITPVIANLLQGNAWPRLCDGVDQWLCFDREGELQSLPLASLRAAGCDDDQETVRIDDKTLARILNAGRADALANLLYENFPEVLPADQGALVYRRLQATSELAEERGIESTADQMALAVAVCVTDGALLENEKFPAWLDEQACASGNFADALGEWMESHT